MTKEQLKKMIAEDHNSFLDFIKTNGISEEIRNIIDEIESEMDGSNIELSPLLDYQGI